MQATIRSLPLTGVDAAALRARSLPAGARGAPGAGQGLLAAPAVLTGRIRTAGFSTLGVSWRPSTAAADLLIRVRTHTAAGWSAWDELGADSGDDPTAAPAGVRAGTDPLWVGPSDGVQARVVVRSGALPADLKLELVDPGTPAGTGTPLAAAARAAATTPATTPAGGVAEPLIFSRAQWGADDSRIRNPPTYLPTIKAFVIHHTAGPNDYTAAQVPGIIRGDYAYHLSRGWSDIGYNALIDRFGRIWEGRAGGLDRAVMGAHAGGFNSDTFGVSVIGNYDTARPSAASIAALTRLIAWKVDANHRDPLGSTELTSAGGGTARYRSGTAHTFPVIMGHRDTGFTDCPGRYLYPFLPSIRAGVKSAIRAALLDPAGPPASAPAGRPVAITARAMAAQTWALDVSGPGPCSSAALAHLTGSAPAGGLITARWNGLLAGGAAARPGRYTLRLSSSSTSPLSPPGAPVIARPVTGSVLLVPPAPAAEPAATPSAGSGGYTPIVPTRLLDTSTGRAGIGPGGRIDLPVLARAGVPASAVTAVVLNLTASCQSDPSALSVWPTGTRGNRPATAIPAGLSRSVLVTTRVGAGGQVSIGNAHGVAELAVDVVGYYSAAGSPVRAIVSQRLYDSRKLPAGPLLPGQPRLIPLPATLGGTPSASLSALIVDVSALRPTGPGTLSAVRPGSSASLATLSYQAGEDVDNLAIVPVSGGAIALVATGAPVDVALDVRGLVLTGSLTGSQPGSPGSPGSPASSPGSPGSPGTGGTGEFTALASRTVYDSATSGGPIPALGARRVVLTGGTSGVPVGVSAVLLSLTATAPPLTTWLQTYPWGRPATGGAALRASAGQTRSNLVLQPVGADGAISVMNARGAAPVRIDVLGYLG